MIAKALVSKRGASSRREGPSVERLGPTKATPSRRKKVPVKSDYVGIDLHRRRSVIVRVSPDGEHLSTVKIDNDPIALAAARSLAAAIERCQKLCGEDVPKGMMWSQAMAASAEDVVARWEELSGNRPWFS